MGTRLQELQSELLNMPFGQMKILAVWIPALARLPATDLVELSNWLSQSLSAEEKPAEVADFLPHQQPQGIHQQMQGFPGPGFPGFPPPPPPEQNQQPWWPNEQSYEYAGARNRKARTHTQKNQPLLTELIETAVLFGVDTEVAQQLSSVSLDDAKNIVSMLSASTPNPNAYVQAQICLSQVNGSGGFEKKAEIDAFVSEWGIEAYAVDMLYKLPGQTALRIVKAMNKRKKPVKDVSSLVASQCQKEFSNLGLSDETGEPRTQGAPLPPGRLGHGKDQGGQCMNSPSASYTPAGSFSGHLPVAIPIAMYNSLMAQQHPVPQGPEQNGKWRPKKSGTKDWEADEAQASNWRRKDEVGNTTSIVEACKACGKKLRLDKAAWGVLRHLEPEEAWGILSNVNEKTRNPSAIVMKEGKSIIAEKNRTSECEAWK
eukprot:TRINITY_DN46910_c0_g1_i1.p1 TRINITY_DN46910_c0_g1~~TRINITY_DN46910_c0_g1_i1.p1  ORF type:complete len:429 (-),score=70.15 TRINITY_DN46910_c0_g1_i1:133-1419(-)